MSMHALAIRKSSNEKKWFCNGGIPAQHRNVSESQEMQSDDRDIDIEGRVANLLILNCHDLRNAGEVPVSGSTNSGKSHSSLDRDP